MHANPIFMSGNSDSHEKRFGPPLGAIIGTVLGVVIWLVFIILYALDWSKRFDLFQNIVVTVASFLITGLLIALMWMIWIFSTGKHRFWWSDDD